MGDFIYFFVNYLTKLTIFERCPCGIFDYETKHLFDLCVKCFDSRRQHSYTSNITFITAVLNSFFKYEEIIGVVEFFRSRAPL